MSDLVFVILNFIWGQNHQDQVTVGGSNLPELEYFGAEKAEVNYFLHFQHRSKCIMSKLNKKQLKT